MMNGVSLKPDTVVTLSLDGTLVFVESIGNPKTPEAVPLYIAVVALPDQVCQSVFILGRVGSTKISPFSQIDKVIPISDLSERNQKFITTYRQLREEHGANYRDLTDEELGVEARVKKSTPDKAAVDTRLRRKCGLCREQPGHPIHQSDHAFVEPKPKLKRKARS